MKKFKLFLKIIVFICLFIGVLYLGFYLYSYFSPPIKIKSTNQIFLYDNQDNLIYTGSGTNNWVELENINKNYLNAVIAVEDKNFYSHSGFDYLRIGKAFYTNVKNGEIIEGASTISQQYIKNLYLDFKKTWSRKIEEAILTLNLEVHYTKDDILEGYVNTINYGLGNYGINDASLFYFNKKPSELNIEEAIILAGIPKNPTKYNPVSNLENAISRAKNIANFMYKNEFLSKVDYDKLDFKKVVITGSSDTNNLNTLMYYQDAVMEELEHLTALPNSLIDTGSLKIYTTLNMESQKQLENSISKYMKDDETQVSSVVIDPKTGGVIALSGGRNYNKSEFNRALNSKRQVGSTMKPILYYSALENGFTSASTFKSEETSFALSSNKSYDVHNYNNIYANDNITMAAAIAYSDNIYAVKTHLFLGMDNLVNISKKMGINTQLVPIASLALGTNEINILDFANAYTTLASNGFKRNQFFIRKIEDENSKIIYEKDDKSELILNQNYVYILNDLLTSTYNSKFVAYNKPTALSISSMITKKYSIKSGSTGTDFWTVGYNPDILCLVWTGNDDNSHVDTDYASITKKIWASTVENTLVNVDNHWYETPQNIIGVFLDPITGNYSENSDVLFYFVKGTEPK